MVRWGVPIDDWFLTTTERGNPATRIDAPHAGDAWSRGNRCTLLVHGSTYFARLVEVVEQMGEGDLLLFTDWRGDHDELLGPQGPRVGDLFAAAAARGVQVHGLFWRSHLDRLHYSEHDNRIFADQLRAAGGHVLLDQRVRPLGSHHQKFVVARHRGRPERDVCFVGGIDLCHTRRDDATHAGDPQTVGMGAVWGMTPAWHDAMLEVSGPAVADVETNFRERWEDPHSPAPDPLSLLEAAVHRDTLRPRPLPAQWPAPPQQGNQLVQVLRTFPPRRPAYPFAPQGERSLARAYGKAMGMAERIVYLEDQYLWSAEVVSCFATALRREPGLRMVVVLSTFTTEDAALANASAMPARGAALAALHRAGGERVQVFGLENHDSTPIYVHSKVCVVDDLWFTCGSDNVNRRSWTYDSELTCAVIDQTPAERGPGSLRHDGEGARHLARELRVQLMREHLDRADGDDADLLDAEEAVQVMMRSAEALDAWHAGGQVGPRPAGRLRRYIHPSTPAHLRPVGALAYRHADDPDGRPRPLRGSDRF